MNNNKNFRHENYKYNELNRYDRNKDYKQEHRNQRLQVTVKNDRSQISSVTSDTKYNFHNRQLTNEANLRDHMDLRYTLKHSRINSENHKHWAAPSNHEYTNKVFDRYKDVEHFDITRDSKFYEGKKVDKDYDEKNYEDSRNIPSRSIENSKYTRIEQSDELRDVDAYLGQIRRDRDWTDYSDKNTFESKDNQRLDDSLSQAKEIASRTRIMLDKINDWKSLNIVKVDDRTSGNIKHHSASHHSINRVNHYDNYGDTKDLRNYRDHEDINDPISEERLDCNKSNIFYGRENSSDYDANKSAQHFKDNKKDQNIEKQMNAHMQNLLPLDRARLARMSESQKDNYILKSNSKIAKLDGKAPETQELLQNLRELAKFLVPESNGIAHYHMTKDEDEVKMDFDMHEDYRNNLDLDRNRCGEKDFNHLTNSSHLEKQMIGFERIGVSSNNEGMKSPKKSHDTEPDSSTTEIKPQEIIQTQFPPPNFLSMPPPMPGFVPTPYTFVTPLPFVSHVPTVNYIEHQWNQAPHYMTPIHETQVWDQKTKMFLMNLGQTKDLSISPCSSDDIANNIRNTSSLTDTRDIEFDDRKSKTDIKHRADREFINYGDCTESNVRDTKQKKSRKESTREDSKKHTRAKSSHQRDEMHRNLDYKRYTDNEQRNSLIKKPKLDEHYKKSTSMSSKERYSSKIHHNDQLHRRKYEYQSSFNREETRYKSLNKREAIRSSKDEEELRKTKIIKVDTESTNNNVDHKYLNKRPLEKFHKIECSRIDKKILTKSLTSKKDNVKSNQNSCTLCKSQESMTPTQFLNHLHDPSHLKNIQNKNPFGNHYRESFVLEDSSIKGLNHLLPITRGFYCDICHLFFGDERMVLEHVSLNRHHQATKEAMKLLKSNNASSKAQDKSVTKVNHLDKQIQIKSRFLKKLSNHESSQNKMPTIIDGTKKDINSAISSNQIVSLVLNDMIDKVFSQCQNIYYDKINSCVINAPIGCDETPQSIVKFILFEKLEQVMDVIQPLNRQTQKIADLNETTYDLSDILVDISLNNVLVEDFSDEFKNSNILKFDSISQDSEELGVELDDVKSEIHYNYDTASHPKCLGNDFINIKTLESNLENNEFCKDVTINSTIFSKNCNEIESNYIQTSQENIVMSKDSTNQNKIVSTMPSQINITDINNDLLKNFNVDNSIIFDKNNKNFSDDNSTKNVLISSDLVVHKCLTNVCTENTNSCTIIEPDNLNSINATSGNTN